MVNQSYIFENNQAIIEIADEQDLTYWTNRLNVSAEKLKSAIRATRSMDCEMIISYLKQLKQNNC
ncbi:DUF3606 domain-containing protein [Pedobacter namyangjuensis]|uniref:DUF3606 domain-containing protein n=1 Tax=Pedobacter namyangjuensis TaxID=600626 RepID=UPI000DE36DB5